MAKKEFPEIKENNEGKFTKWVEKNMGGMDTCKAASKIMRSRTKKYSPAVVKMANYANNFGCKTKKEDGASMQKPPLKKMKSKKAITGLEKLKVREYKGKQYMERGSQEGSHSRLSDDISEFNLGKKYDTNKSTQQQVTETGKYRDKEREKKYLKAALKSTKKK